MLLWFCDFRWYRRAEIIPFLSDWQWVKVPISINNCSAKYGWECWEPSWLSLEGEEEAGAHPCGEFPCNMHIPLFSHVGFCLSLPFLHILPSLPAGKWSAWSWETLISNCSIVIAQLTWAFSLSFALQDSACHRTSRAWWGFFSVVFTEGSAVLLGWLLLKFFSLYSIQETPCMSRKNVTLFLKDGFPCSHYPRTIHR